MASGRGGVWGRADGKGARGALWGVGCPVSDGAPQHPSIALLRSCSHASCRAPLPSRPLRLEALTGTPHLGVFSGLPMGNNAQGPQEAPVLQDPSLREAQRGDKGHFPG